MWPCLNCICLQINWWTIKEPTSCRSLCKGRLGWKIRDLITLSLLWHRMKNTAETMVLEWCKRDLGSKHWGTRGSHLQSILSNIHSREAAIEAIICCPTPWYLLSLPALSLTVRKNHNKTLQSCKKPKAWTQHDSERLTAGGSHLKQSKVDSLRWLTFVYPDSSLLHVSTKCYWDRCRSKHENSIRIAFKNGQGAGLLLWLLMQNVF